MVMDGSMVVSVGFQHGTARMSVPSQEQYIATEEKEMASVAKFLKESLSRNLWLLFKCV